MTHTRVRSSYNTMMQDKFLDKKTGAYEQLKNSPWYLKMREGKPTYYLKMDDKYQAMPEKCFHATAARSSTFDLANVELQIENFFKNNLGYLEVRNEDNKNKRL